MSELLFSYGTLQYTQVQLKTFGRRMISRPDSLVGYMLRDCLIQDHSVVETSGASVHPIACFTGKQTDLVPGVILEVTAAELAQADSYEVDAYTRVKCLLQSGAEAWVYVQSSNLPICDTTFT